MTLATLNNAINKYKEVIKKAKEAENKIEKKTIIQRLKKLIRRKRIEI